MGAIEVADLAMAYGETKAVDGQDNPIVAFETNKFDEVQKHLSTTRHVYNPLVVLISRNRRYRAIEADERRDADDDGIPDVYQRES